MNICGEGGIWGALAPQNPRIQWVEATSALFIIDDHYADIYMHLGVCA